jgi:hypothetical protein
MMMMMITTTTIIIIMPIIHVLNITSISYITAEHLAVIKVIRNRIVFR